MDALATDAAVDAELDTTLAQARARYRERRPGSWALHQRASEVLPGGNTRTVLYHPPFPMRVASGSGATITDVDGNVYVDLLGEYTAGLFGHSNPVILEALHATIDKGLSLGAHNPYEPVLAAALVDRFPALELLRFTNSGTEANLMAVSVARAFTGRSSIAVAEGGYHGGLLSFDHGPSRVNAPYDTVMLRFNDIDASVAAIRAAGPRLAAVLIETTQGSAGVVPGDPAYLQAVQAAAREVGALLVVDEVMTSRLAWEGASPGLGLEPDLITLGKYLGGGASFGAFGGRADVMALFDPSQPGSLAHAGTFNNNVLSMAAGVAGMTKVLTPERLADLNERGDRLRTSLHEVLAPYGWCATGRGSMIGLHPSPGPVHRIDDLHDADARRREILFLALLERGWYLALRGFMALSLEITDAHVAAVVGDVADVLASEPYLRVV